MILIDFEGIDGSGKSTLSQMVEKELRARGAEVFHTRGNDELQSPLSSEIRLVSRNPNRLPMSDWTEALLYLSRENQLLEEKVLRYRDRDVFVITDRYFYSHLVLSSHVRGLEKKFFLELIEHLSHGIEPDLVFLCDVDIVTSRIRKRIQKAKKLVYNDFGRKGLSGLALREKTRDGFLKLASESDKWHVVDNMTASLESAFVQIMEKIEAKFGDKLKKGPPERPSSQAPGHVADVRHPCKLKPDEIEQCFYRNLEDLSPDYQCYYLTSIGTDKSYKIREERLAEVPELVAFSLNKLDDDRAFDLFDKLAETCPKHVLLSQSNKEPLKERSIGIRQKLLSVSPKEAVYTCRGQDSEWAWEIREAAMKKHTRTTIFSLSGLDTERAWKIREKYVSKKYGNEVLQSLRYIDNERAWEIREKYLETHPAFVIVSLAGLAVPRAHEIRRMFMGKAPKLVAGSVHGIVDEDSWDIRENCLGAYTQVLASIKHIDHPRADTLRKKLYHQAPPSVLNSLGFHYNKYTLEENPWIRMGWDEYKGYFPFIKRIVEREDKRRRVYAGSVE